MAWARCVFAPSPALSVPAARSSRLASLSSRHAIFAPPTPPSCAMGLSHTPSRRLHATPCYFNATPCPLRAVSHPEAPFSPHAAPYPPRCALFAPYPALFEPCVAGCLHATPRHTIFALLSHRLIPICIRRAHCPPALIAPSCVLRAVIAPLPPSSPPHAVAPPHRGLLTPSSRLCRATLARPSRRPLAVARPSRRRHTPHIPFTPRTIALFGPSSRPSREGVWHRCEGMQGCPMVHGAVGHRAV
ncbi:hypothetical protein DENSPDRAFT_886497 [Dentipellis sp. KUC8613]|nr:hypothetical protein DENSPDRAFT_886497 [Dentipellis sp. KUC8613]